MRRPTALITLGDPSGIGGEIVLKALQSPRIRRLGRLVVIGTGALFKKMESLTGLRWPTGVCLVDLKNLKKEELCFGKISSSSGQATFEFLQEALRLLLAKEGHFLVTAPLHKESLKKAGFPWPGHTEMLQELTKTKKVNMMFVGKKFRVSLATWHVSMKRLPQELTAERILDAAFLLHDALKRYFSKKSPRLALCALNPHAGEGGLLGDEERSIILPAARRLQKKGIQIQGPFPADTLFYYAYRGAFDGVVAMYHDQALIPFKMIERDSGVNVTLGLPFLRTSPDHGTAFDIAGKNCADPQSMMRAIQLGYAMFHSSKRGTRPCG